MDVLPRPFRTLFKVVLRYKNGQIQDSVCRNFPANSLEKIKFPKNFPKNRKKRRQPIPRVIQKENVFDKVRFNDFKVPSA